MVLAVVAARVSVLRVLSRAVCGCVCRQVIQIFESWAHQLSPSQFLAFSKPYAEKVTAIIKERHPEVGGLLLRACLWWIRMAPGETRGA